MVGHLIDRSGLPEVAAEMSRQLDAQGITDPKVRGEALIAGLKAAMTPTRIQRLVSLLKRLFDLESDAQRLARKLFSSEGDARRAREQQDTDKAIQAALAQPNVQQAMRDTGLTEGHVRDVHRRLMLYGDPRMAARAILNPDLLRWFAQNGGLEMRLNQNQAIQLFMFAKEGHL